MTRIENHGVEGQEYSPGCFAGFSALLNNIKQLWQSASELQEGSQEGRLTSVSDLTEPLLQSSDLSSSLMSPLLSDSIASLDKYELYEVISDATQWWLEEFTASLTPRQLIELKALENSAPLLEKISPYLKPKQKEALNSDPKCYFQNDEPTDFSTIEYAEIMTRPRQQSISFFESFPGRINKIWQSLF